MPTKTRKQKKQKGGAIPFLPRNAAPIEGVESKLISNFYTKNNIYYVSAHGSMLPREEFVVPANTYILHAGVSGKVCGEDTSIIELLQGEGLNSSEKKKQLWKFLTGQLKGQVYNNILYNPEVFNLKKGTLAIYEPGDIANDMNLSFLNEGFNSGFIEHGVYEYPTADSLFEHAKGLQEERARFFNQKRQTRGKASNANIKALMETAAKEFSNAHNKEFHRRADNKLKPYFLRTKEHTLLESELIDLPEFPQPPEGFRLFIVFSCRGISGIPLKEREAAAKAARRKSINLRRYDPLAKVLHNVQEGKKLNLSLYDKVRKELANQNSNRLLNEAMNDLLLEEALDELYKGKN